MQPRLIASLIVIGLLLLFALQNASTVEIAFLVWRIEMSRALLLFFVFLLGGIVGWVLRTAIAHHRRDRSTAQQAPQKKEHPASGR